MADKTGIAYELKAAERSTRDCLLWYFGSTDPALIREQMEKLLRIQSEHKAIIAERERREKEDAEPITEEWLRSIVGELDTIMNNEGDERICWLQDVGDVDLPMPQTKGQFLRLLEALGIERKGG